MKPSYEYWGPWIGDDTRSSDFVLNTEYQKCSMEPDGELEEPVPEEILMHILKDEKVRNIILRQISCALLLL